ncbi:patatin-like phospholipase family protein [Pseudophaeobacter sp.]|uniref:patatin-like phospholipase family protein n=1 Tax=Pseudophaeobacter sp. TaxID=1971739 RepID=UPI0032981CC4
MVDPKHAKSIGLALSGGGFRATLFHCGALIRLNEMGMLPRIDRIASVSGGSITAARLAKVWAQLDFDDTGVATNLDPLLTAPLRAFCSKRLDVSVIAGGLIPFTKSATERLTEAYDKALLGGMTLNQLPESPDFVFMSTNLQTGRSFRFSRYHLADYLVGEIGDTSPFLVAQAVAASSAFPPILSPVKIKVRKKDWSDLPGTEFFGQDDYMTELHLTDGGVYDNLGLERINHFGTVFSSDAGKPFAFGPSFAQRPFKQLLRILSVAMDQTRALRTRHMIEQASQTDQRVCLWGADQGVTKNPAPGIMPRSEEIISEIKRLRTRLNPFSEQEQGHLINWGYVSCDERMRTYVLPNMPPPTALPAPDFPIS